MKRILLGFLLLIISVSLYAQQRPQYTMYMANPYLVNPAMAGSEDFVDIKAGYRNQWTGWGDAAPKTTYLSAHAPVGKPHTEYHHYSDRKNWLGVGGKILNDQTGPISSTTGLLTASYDFGISKGFGYGGLAHRDGIRAVVGLDFGVQQYELNINNFNDPTAVNISEDPAVTSSTTINPDANFGAWIYQENLFFLGFSSMQILGNDVNLDYVEDKATISLDDRNVLARLNRHYFVTAGYKFLIGPNLGFYPSFMMKKVVGAPMSWDINGKLDYLDGQYWAGISYRHGDALNLLIGTAINYRYEIAYSYDMTVNAIREYSNGSHEIMIGYRIPFKFRMNNPGEHNNRMGKHKTHHW